MPHPIGSFIADSVRQAGRTCHGGWHVLLKRGPSQFQFWLIALMIGIASGFAALFFRKGIEALQAFIYGTDDVSQLRTFADSLPWYWVLIIPICGGLIVGVILDRMTPDARAHERKWKN